MSRWAALLLGSFALSCAQFGTLRVDWEDAADDGDADSHVVVQEVVRQAQSSLSEDINPADEPSVHSDAFEDAWWRGGYATDTDQEWFGQSKEVRSPKPESVLLSVGQVYVHAKTGARGVIVGWDARTRAPRQWVEYNAGQLGASYAKLSAPHYSVIEELDEDSAGNPSQKGKMSFLTRYVIGDFLLVRDDGHPVEPLRYHPDVAAHFGSYNANTGRYSSLSWLRERYPHG